MGTQLPSEEERECAKLVAVQTIDRREGGGEPMATQQTEFECDCGYREMAPGNQPPQHCGKSMHPAGEEQETGTTGAGAAGTQQGRTNPAGQGAQQRGGGMGGGQQRTNPAGQAQGQGGQQAQKP
jgi:hypothetical protein